MKTSHGDPPQAHPGRHLSNSSNDGVKACSKSEISGQKMKVPTLLRLDSAGEGGSYYRPVKEGAGHLRTNTCRQGEPLGVFRKLMSFNTQLSQPQHLLESSRAQNDFCALDQLVERKQAMSSMAAMAGKPTHVKMMRPNLPHLNQYGFGHWGTSYAFLPRGVFPCHVFRAAQSLKGLPTTCSTTSGHFILEAHMAGGNSYLKKNSLLETSKFPAECSNSLTLQKVESESPGSADCVFKESEIFQKANNQSPSTVEIAQARADLSGQIGASCSQFDEKTVSGEKCSSNTTELEDQQNMEKTVHHEMNESTRGLGEVKRLVCQSQFDNRLKGEGLDSNMAEISKNPAKPELHTEGGDRLSVHINCTAVSAYGIVETHTVVEKTIGRIDGQSSSDEESSDSEIEDVCSADGNESEEVWSSFMSSQFSLFNLCSKPKKETHERKTSLCGEEKRCTPKPCPAVTKQWFKMYAECAERSPCKVRFECGEGKDNVHEYEKLEEETLTAMEIQKAKDLCQQHRGKAATLLHTSEDHASTSRGVCGQTGKQGGDSHVGQTDGIQADKQGGKLADQGDLFTDGEADFDDVLQDLLVEDSDSEEESDDIKPKGARDEEEEEEEEDNDDEFDDDDIVFE